MFVRAFKIIGAAAISAALTSCAPQGGAKVASLDRPLSAEYVQIVSASTSLVEIDASGALVRAEAPKGFCIPRDSIQTSREAVFLLIGECGSSSEEVAGVLSVSVSNGPLSTDLPSLERFLRTDVGIVGLGYGGDREDLMLIDVRLDGEALIALVEDRSEFGPAFAGDVIGRAFTELNGRMAVITLLSRRNNPRDPEIVRRDLSKIVRSLRATNA